jgi:hypothetical protein
MKLYTLICYIFISFILSIAQAQSDIEIKMKCGDDEMDANCIAAGRVEYIYLIK